jgi:hypothetical protein
MPSPVLGAHLGAGHPLAPRGQALRLQLWRRASTAAGSSAPSPGRDAASAAEALRAELAASAGQEIRVDIHGSATMLVEVALAAGLRLTDPGLLLLSPADQPPPTALAIHTYWLL